MSNTAKCKVGDRLLVSRRFEITITKISAFNGCDHYGFTWAEEELGEATKYGAGWIPCAILDWQMMVEQKPGIEKM